MKIDLIIILVFIAAVSIFWFYSRKTPDILIPNVGIKLPDGVLCLGCEVIYSHHLDFCPYCGEKERYKLSDNLRPLRGDIKEVKHGLSDDQRAIFKVPQSLLDQRTSAANKTYMGYIALDHFYPFPHWSFNIPGGKPIIIAIDPEVQQPPWTIALYNQCREFGERVSGIVKKSIWIDAGKTADMGKGIDKGRDNKAQGRPV